MKRTGKGKGIQMTPNPKCPIKKRNQFSGISEGCTVREWQPLRSWPVAPHVRQAEIDALRVAPSRYAP